MGVCPSPEEWWAGAGRGRCVRWGLRPVPAPRPWCLGHPAPLQPHSPSPLWGKGSPFLPGGVWGEEGQLVPARWKGWSPVTWCALWTSTEASRMTATWSPQPQFYPVRTTRRRPRVGGRWTGSSPGAWSAPPCSVFRTSIGKMPDFGVKEDILRRGRQEDNLGLFGVELCPPPLIHMLKS